MDRYDAIKKVSDAILNDGLTEALFLKGSIARNEDDEFSDVDLYAVVSEQNKQLFLHKRIGYLEAYMPLIYWSESNFVGPQIVGVFENALHFDLYMVEQGHIPQTDDIKVIYDSGGILNSYQKQSLVADPAVALNEFTFSLLEFEIAYSRKDLIWATRLAGILSGYLSLVLRYVYDKENSQLGSKRLYRYLPKEIYDEFIHILNHLTPIDAHIGIKQLVSLAEKSLELLPLENKEQVNVCFFDMMKQRIDGLK